MALEPVPQAVWPVAQVNGVTQALAMQSWPVAQAWAQEPQFALSVAVLTQDELHSVCPVGHVMAAMHAPAAQVWPVAHAWPQVPQLAALVWTFTQVVPQSS